MNPEFNLLILNPILNTDNYHRISSDYITHSLQTPLYLPVCDASPFVFSCFALSIDGKLCYPDLLSGYSIAGKNNLATEEERYADYWNLMLGRSISDAVIIGRNSLMNECFKYQANIDHDELIHFRKTLNKGKDLLHIIITQDISKLDLKQEIIFQDLDIPVIIYAGKKPEKIYPGFVTRNISEINLNDTKQIVYEQDFLNISLLTNKLFSLGIKTILNESPFLHHILQDQKLLNEAWLNTSGVYIGGNITSLGQSQPPFNSTKHPHYTILSLHHIANNFLYTRYKIGYIK